MTQIFENNMDNKYLNLCKEGRIMESVKVYRVDTGCSLAEAKTYIDKLCSEHGIQTNSSRRTYIFVISLLVLLSLMIFLSLQLR